MEGEKYIKGFNDGYILSKYKSPLASSISKTIEKNNDYNEGFVEGIEIQEREMTEKNIQEIKKTRGENDLNIER